MERADLDINKREFHGDVTVGEMIEILKGLPPEAKFACCGDGYFYTHITEDNSVVSIDWSDLDEHYEEIAEDGL